MKISKALSEDEKKLRLQLKMSEVKDSIVNSLCGVFVFSFGR